MRVLLVARRYWPAVGGVESYLRHVAQALANHHSVTVLAHRIDDAPHEALTDSLSPPPTFAPFQDDSVRVVPLQLSPGQRRRLLPMLALATPVLRRYAYGRLRVPLGALYARVAASAIVPEAQSADVVHMWAGDLLASAAVHAARESGAGAVVTPFAHRDQWGTDPASVAAYRAADRVIALVEDDARLYRELGVADDRLAVCGVCSPGVAGGGGDRLRRERGIEGPLVLFLGVRRPYKGHDLLLRAAPAVAARLPGVTFAFVGPGPPVDPPPGVRVIDAGEMSAEDRAPWLDAADILCLPSKAEIFPVSMLEAWSVRTPVLVSDIPPLLELIRASGGGEAVALRADALAESIIRMLGSPDQLAQYGESGYRFWSSHHTPEAVARRHEQVYVEAANSRSPAAQ
jgi:glycosyltransferase involved in cell wall biosynthesis